MTEEQYIPLIHRSLTDQLSEGEMDHLQEWLAANTQNLEIYADIVKGWEISNSYELPFTVDTDRAFDKFLETSEEKSTTTNTKSPTPVRRLWPAISAVVAIGLLLLGVIWAWQATRSSQPVLVETIATTARTLVILPDQSVVTLNEGAKISYDPNFKKREIQLNGEAFFDVTKNPQKPFTILTKNTATTVLGTSFNIKNEATKTTVTVFTGKVSFEDLAGKNESLILTSTQRGIYQSDNQSLSKEADIALETLNWQKENITFEDQMLSKILPALETFYDVSIELNEPTLSNCSFDVTLFRSSSLNDALETLASTGAVTFTKKANKIVLDGEGCPLSN